MVRNINHYLPLMFISLPLILILFIHKAKQLIQIAILGAQVIGRAFTRALRQELQCNKQLLS